MVAATNWRRYPPNLTGSADGFFHGVPVETFAHHHTVGHVFLVQCNKGIGVALGAGVLHAEVVVETGRDGRVHFPLQAVALLASTALLASAVSVIR